MGDNKKKGDAYLADVQVPKRCEGFTRRRAVQDHQGKGNGKKPVESDMIEVNYRGTLINGNGI